MKNVERYADLEIVDPPVEANASPLPDQLWTAFRQLVLALSAFALGKEWIDGEAAALIAAILGIAAPVVMGQLKVRRRAKELATVAASPEVPDKIARLRGAAR